MKNLKKQAVALMLSGAIVFGNIATFASNDLKNKDLIKVEKTANLQHELNPVTNSMKVVLGVMMDQSQKLKLEIFDEGDNLVHKDTYNNTKGFIQLFDMTALGEGEYIFRITSGNTSYIDKVTVNGGNRTPEEETFQAYISDIKNNKLKFSYADAKGDVIFSLIDSNGETIFSESLGEEFSSSGQANLSKLVDGKYTVQLSSSTGTETKEIKIR